MLLTFISALSVLAFVRAHFEPTPRRLLTWALAWALALFAQYFAAGVVVPEAAWLAFVYRRRWLVWAGSFASTDSTCARGARASRAGSGASMPCGHG